MSTGRTAWVGLLFLTATLGAGCAGPSVVRAVGEPEARTVASVGDRPLPVLPGESGTLLADGYEPERRPDPEGRISGRVVDARGEPVPNVPVRLAVDGTRSGRAAVAITDPSGGFTLQGLRPGGSYTVIAETHDERGVYLGRAQAQAPQGNVQIRLVAQHGDGSDTAATEARPPLHPVSRRNDASEDLDDDFDDFDDFGVDDEDDDRSPPRLNVEDLPPADPAEHVTTGRHPRADAGDPSLGLDAATRWQRAGSAMRPNQAATASVTDPGFDCDDDFGPATPRASRLPVADDCDDDGPNPLPPAIETDSVPDGASFGFDGTPNPSDPALRDSDLGPGPDAEPDAQDFDAFLPLDDCPEHEDLAAFVADEVRDDSEFISPPSLSQQTSPMEEAEAPTTAAAAHHDEAVTMAQSSPADGAQDQPGEDAAVAAAPTSEPACQRPTWADLAEQFPVSAPSDDRPSPTSATMTPGPRDRSPSPPPRRLTAQHATHQPAPRPRPTRDPRTTRASCQYDAKNRRLVDFVLPDTQGTMVSLQDFDADYVLIDFWGTWCQPCANSIPHLIELQKRLGPERLQVIGVAYEQEGTPEEQAAAVERAARYQGINYPVLLGGLNGPCPLQAALFVQHFPTMVLVDRQGRVVWRDQGAVPATLDRLDRVLASSTGVDLLRQ